MDLAQSNYNNVMGYGCLMFDEICILPVTNFVGSSV